jgi:DNA-binding CsgD family transcriptional regulator
MGRGVTDLLREVRRLTPDSSVASVLRVIVETARTTAGASFSALVPVSSEWSNGLITVSVDGYGDGDEVATLEDVERRVAAHAADEHLWRFSITANGGEFAMLYLSRRTEDGPPDPDVDAQMDEFTDVAGIVIERALLADEVNAGSQWTAVFGPLPDAHFPWMSRTTSLFDDLAETARRLTDAACVAIATPSAGDRIDIRAATGYHADRLRGRIVPAETSLMGRVIATLSVGEVDDAASSDLTYAPAARQIALGPTVVIPMRWRDQPVGALMLGNARGGEAVDLERILTALRADPRLRGVLGLEQADTDEYQVPLLKLRGSPDWDWRFDTLAHRELVVLNLLGEGLTNAAIAQRLFLSDKTVRNYVSNTLTKLGMRRVEAAVMAARLLAQLPDEDRR